MSTKEVQDLSCDVKEKSSDLFEDLYENHIKPLKEDVTDKSLEKRENERVSGNSTINSAMLPSSFKLDSENENRSDQINFAFREAFAYLKRSVWIERAILISVCIAVAAGFTVPIIIYALSSDTDRDMISINVIQDVDNCPAPSNTDSVKV